MTTLDIMQKAKRLGTLLAGSPINDDIKEVIINNVARMPEEAIDRLIMAFEAEQEFLTNLEHELQEYAFWQDEEWNKLTALQKRIAEDFVEEEIKEIDRQDKIDELKKDLRS